METLLGNFSGKCRGPDTVVAPSLERGRKLVLQPNTVPKLILIFCPTFNDLRVYLDDLTVFT